MNEISLNLQRLLKRNKTRKIYVLLYFAGEEEIVLQGLNSFRTARGLPALTINENAACLADRFADQILEDMTCSATAPYQLQNYPGVLAYCGVDVNQTREGAVMPVCAPQLVPNNLLSNYTRSFQYTRYLSDAKFTGAGLGTEDDWMVVILTTNTPGGNFGSDENTFIYNGIPLMLRLATT